MASAGDEENSGSQQGQGAPHRHHHHHHHGHPHIHVPNVNLQPGQRLLLQMVPPQVAQVPGQPGVRVIRPAHAHFHVVNTAQHQQHVQNQQRIHQQRLQQQQQRQQEEEAKKEAEQKRKEIQAKLIMSQSPTLDYNEDEGVARLSWQPIDIEEGAQSIEYCVLLYKDGKEEASEIYKGGETSCSVSSDTVLAGHTHEFAVCASTEGETGKESERATLTLPALPPSQPNPPRVSNKGKNNVSFRWNAPCDNGSPISQYELEWDQCRGEWEQIYCDKAKQYKFSHRFTPGSHALFRLRAANELGWSDYSEVLEFSAGAGAPSVPRAPLVVDTSVHGVSLEWTPPCDNGAEITAYKLEMEDPDSGYGFRPVYQGEDVKFICSGLHRNTSYNFRLSAVNEKGHSQFSPSVTYQTLPDVPGPPGAPFLKERATPTSLHITWQLPSDNGGAEIEAYVLQMSSGDGESSPDALVDVYTGPELSYLAEGLKSGKNYQCQVCAISSGGRGKWSQLAQLRTPATRPTPPSSLALVGNPTQTSALLQLGFPLQDGGSSITSYTVEMRQKESDSWKAIATLADPRTFVDSFVDGSLQHEISQLNPGELYHFRAFCRNSVGVSASSIECSCVTAPGVPEPPTGLQVTNVTATSTQLKWQVPVCHGCQVDSYKAQCFPESQPNKLLAVSTSSTECVVRSLTPATSYQLRVKANCAVGASEWSAPAVFTTSPSTPSPPTHLTTVSSTPYSLLVAWTVPECNGSPITAYLIEISASHMTTHVIRVETSETQHTLIDLQPNTTYRYRIQAENSMGKGQFGSTVSGTTLPPPPSPPLLNLHSCSHHTLKLTWGKKPNKGISYMLHMASHNRRFHEVYRGNAVNHRLTRLQADTEYTFKIAAVSESGEGAWSDEVAFCTAPTPPSSPINVELKQTSDDVMQLSWAPWEFPSPQQYEAQFRVVTQGREFQQAYKGPNTSCTIPISVYTTPYEARVRSWSTCTVNGLEEQLWSSYAVSGQCQCREKSKRFETEQNGDDHLDGDDEEDKELVKKESWFSGRNIGVVVFVLLSILTLVLAVLMGQYVL